MIVKILVYTLIRIFISLKLKTELLYIKYQSTFISCQRDNPFPTPISLPPSPTHHWTYKTNITVKNENLSLYITAKKCKHSCKVSEFPAHLTFSTIFITYKLDLKTHLGSENSIGSAKLLRIF